MNNRLILFSGWISAAGLFAMFLTAHGRYSALQEKYEALRSASGEMAFESRQATRAAVQDQKIIQARTAPTPAVPAVEARQTPRPLTRVMLRDRNEFNGLLARARAQAEKNAAEKTKRSALEEATPVEEVEEPSESTGALKEQPAKTAKPDRRAFLENLDRMIADLDRTIQADQKQPKKAPVERRPVESAAGGSDKKTAAGARPSRAGSKQAAPATRVQPEVQVVYVHPFGSRKNGTWVKYHRYQKSADQIKFYFGDQEVMRAPAKAVEFEQRVLIN